MGLIDRAAKVTNKQWIVALAICCAAIWFIACLPTESASNAHTGDEDKNEIRLSIICSDFKCETSKEAPEAKNYQPCEWSYFCGPTATITNYFFKTVDEPVALFTCMLFIATVLLWLVTQAILREASKTSQRQLRAYLFVHKAIFTDITSDGFKVILKIRNFGQTPAYKILVTGTARPMPDPRKRNFDQRTVNALQSHTIGPGGKYLHAIEVSGLPQIAISAVETGADQIYVFGIISYEDCFGVPHTTEYRFLQDGVAQNNAGRFKICDEGNDSN